MTSPRVSVIIPCRNEARHIETCVQGILASTEPTGGFEVVIADGMSDDGTRGIVTRLAEQDARVRMVDNPARTTPHGLNAAIRASRGEVIVRVDAHSAYAPDYLVECVRVLDETGADNVGGPALTRATSPMHAAIAAAYHSRFCVGGAVFHTPTYEGSADTVPYGCYRRSTLELIGLFDEELVRNQDDELNYRLIEAGGRIWQSPAIRSWYTPRDNLHDLFRQYYQYGYWKVRVIQKHGSPASPRHLAPGIAVLALLVLTPLCTVSGLARIALSALLCTYLALLLAASLTTARRSGWRLLPMLPAVFATYHLSYGLGFLLGLWDFCIRRRGGRLTSLTR